MVAIPKYTSRKNEPQTAWVWQEQLLATGDKFPETELNTDSRSATSHQDNLGYRKLQDKCPIFYNEKIISQWEEIRIYRD